MRGENRNIDAMGLPPVMRLERGARAGHVDYVGWFLRLLGWDIVLTAFVAIVPVVFTLVLPGNANAIEMIAVPLPIGAFILRACSGWRHIQANGCDIEMRQQQTSAFMLALVMLVVFDTMMILSHIMPAPAPLAQIDYFIYGGLFLLYLGMMAYAMYPGRVKRAEEWERIARGERL
jgi:hypothetical protein